MRNIRFILTFCFGLSALIAISGSQKTEGTQHPQVWLAVNFQPSQKDFNGVSAAIAIFQGYVDIAKEFLKYEKRILEDLLMSHIRETPQVIMDLPPAIPKFSKTKEL
jgi:hypothetical protein